MSCNWGVNVTEKLDIKMCKSAIVNHSHGACRGKWLVQAIEELGVARSRIAELEIEKQHAEHLARYYHDKLMQRDQRIVELKKEKLKTKDDGYEKGWDDASRDGER